MGVVGIESLVVSCEAVEKEMLFSFSRGEVVKSALFRRDLSLGEVTDASSFLSALRRFSLPVNTAEALRISPRALSPKDFSSFDLRERSADEEGDDSAERIEGTARLVDLEIPGLTATFGCGVCSGDFGTEDVSCEAVAKFTSSRSAGEIGRRNW